MVSSLRQLREAVTARFPPQLEVKVSWALTTRHAHATSRNRRHALYIFGWFIGLAESKKIWNFSFVYYIYRVTQQELLNLESRVIFDWHLLSHPYFAIVWVKWRITKLKELLLIDPCCPYSKILSKISSKNIQQHPPMLCRYGNHLKVIYFMCQ